MTPSSIYRYFFFDTPFVDLLTARSIMPCIARRSAFGPDILCVSKLAVGASRLALTFFFLWRLPRYGRHRYGRHRFGRHRFGRHLFGRHCWHIL